MTTRFAAVTVLGGDVPRPHTTPVAAIRHAGRWWFTTSRHAMKVRFLRDVPVAAITVPDRNGWTTATGDVTILDPADPFVPLDRTVAASAGIAAIGLLGSYARDVAGYLTRLHEIPTAWAPHQRVLVAIDEQIVEHTPALDVRPRHATPCIAGFSDGSRPAAAIGSFDGHDLRIESTARPMSAADGVAVMVDTALLDHDPGRPADQRGLLIRGRVAGPTVQLDAGAPIPIVARSITTWSGFTTETRRFSTAPAEAA